MKKLIMPLMAICLFTTQAFSQVDIDKAVNLSGSGANAKISGIKDVSAPQDAVSAEVLQKGNLVYAVAGGNASAYTLSLPAISVYTDGMELRFKAPVANASPVTLNVNSMGPRTIKKNVSTDLGAGDIQNGQLVTVIYDATTSFFQITSGGLPANIQSLSPSGAGGLAISTGSYNGSSSSTIGIATGGVTSIMMAANSVDLSSNVVTNLLPVNRGGTNSNATPTGGSIAYGNGSGYAFNTPGSPNQVLVSGGTGTPTWNTVAALLGSAGGDLSGSYPNPTVAKLNGASAPTIGGANQILGVNNATSGLEYKTVNGTTNQISIVNAANAITISTPQNIHTGASPTFNTLNVTGANVSGLTASTAVYTDGSKNLTSAAPNNGQIGFWTRDNSNGYLYSSTAADKIGIGTSTPSQLLSIAGATGSTRTRMELYGDANHRFYVYSHPKSGGQEGGIGQGGYVEMTAGGVLSGTKSYAGFNSFNLLITNEASQGFHFVKQAAGVTQFDGTLSEFMTINSSGNVGINMPVPGAKLDVNGGLAVNRNYIYLASGGDANHAITNISATDGEQFRFFNFLDFYQTNGANTTRLYINSSGNVGIGTTSWSASGARFAVHYSAANDQVMTLRNTSATGLSSVRLEDETGAYMGDVGYDNTANIIRIGGNAAVNKYFDGNVGIGNNNPGNKLVIDGVAPVEEIRSGGYLMMRPAGNSWDMRLQATTGVAQRLDVYSGGDLATPIASFIHGGSMGVGTTTPDSKLDVNGELDFNSVKKQLVFEASTAGNTYIAGTWYDIGPAQTLGDNVDGAHYIVGVSVQYNTPVGYHTMIGTGTIGFTSWKNSGNQPGAFMWLEHHNADDVYCYVRGKLGNGARVMQIMFGSNVPIDPSGGKVRIFMKRIF